LKTLDTDPITNHVSIVRGTAVSPPRRLSGGLYFAAIAVGAVAAAEYLPVYSNSPQSLAPASIIRRQRTSADPLILLNLEVASFGLAGMTDDKKHISSRATETIIGRKVRRRDGA
jgi:hypothetical protein